MDTHSDQTIADRLRELVKTMRAIAKDSIDKNEQAYIVGWLLNAARDVELALGDPID